MPRSLQPSTPLEDLEAVRAAGPTPPSVLTEELADFCQSGVSVILGARGRNGRPISGMALACVIDARGVIRVLLREPANTALVEGLVAGSAVAATFSLPRNHRSIQFKASGARVLPAAPGDLAEVARQTAIFRAELEFVHYTPTFSGYYCAYRDEELVAIEFTPEQAFVQTPGPGAGSVLAP